jgi:hypothetical protein
MESGLVATFLIYPVGDIAENRHRVVIQYRREDLINWRQKSFVICRGLANSLVSGGASGSL